MNTSLKELFENPILKLTNDFVFKKVITCPKDNYIILRSLIHSVIGGPKIASLQILNSEDTLENKQMKQIRFDIKAELEDGQAIEIEMQKASSRIELKERAAYYASRLYAKQEARGLRYSSIKPTYSIIFCDFPFFEKKEQWKEIYAFKAEENSLDILTDKVKVIIIEIDKGHLFDCLPIEQLSTLQQWIILLGMRNSQRAQAIIKKEPILEMAVDELRKITQSEIEQAWAESRYKYEVDEIAFRLTAQDEGREAGLKEGLEEGIKQGLEKGLEQGLEKGKNEKAVQIAQKMLDENLDIDFIMHITGLTKDEILHVKNDKTK